VLSCRHHRAWGVAVEFRILGPLEVLDKRGLPLPLGGAKQRALLAVLLLQAGEAVSADRLIDELWGEDPPKSARSVLQVYVANLRKLLEPARPSGAPSTVLVRRPPGYLLDPGPHAFDLSRFERLVGASRTALTASGPQSAVAALRQALSLWRGPAAGDVVLLGRSHGAVTELEERRLAALEDRIELDLALGRHRDLVGELESLVVAHPLRERLRGQQMVALYRCGRQAEALDAYRQTREMMAEELGIDPSRPLQELERAILAQDPLLDWGPVGEKSTAPILVAPSERSPTSPRAEPALTSPAMTTGPAPSAAKRTVTVVSVGIAATKGGKQLDPESSEHLEASYVDRLRQILEDHGGTVQQLSSEGGTAVFGIPVLHENDAVRAVRAAAEVHEALEHASQSLTRDWNVQLAFSGGVQTGEVVAASGRGDRLSLVGATLTLARTLEQAAAAGEILLGAATYGLVRDAVRVERVAPLMPKAGEPMAAWRLLAVKPRAAGRARRLDAPLVGRTRELALLAQAFEWSVAERACHLFTILGPAGVGKSRLITEFLQRVGEQATVLSGRCLDYGKGITYWPIAEVVRAATGATGAKSATKVQVQVAGLIEDTEQADTIAERVTGLIGLGSGAASAEEIAWAVRKLLESVARRHPLVLVLDDLHWAEPALLDLVEHVADWARDAPLLLCCVTRPELLDRRPTWGGGKPHATSITLEALGIDDCGRLLDNLLGAVKDSQAVRARIIQMAEGNPLFLEELVAMLIEDGVLQRTDGNWVVAGDPATMRIPEGISALLGARIAQLPQEERAAIIQASVMGQVFYLGALTELASGTVGAELPTHLLRLARKDLIRPHRSDLPGQEAFRFRHLLIRDAAYEALTKRARADLHERFGAWLEATAGERLTEIQEVVGYHLECAYGCLAELGPVDQAGRQLSHRAARHLAAAGQRAWNRHDFPAAATLFGRAAALLPPTDPEGIRLLAKSGEALIDTEELQRAGPVVQEALDRATAIKDPIVTAHTRIAAHYFRAIAGGPSGWETAARRELKEAIALLEELDDTAGLARAWRLVVHLDVLDMGDARIPRQVLHYARRSGDPLLVRWARGATVWHSYWGPTPVDRCIDLCLELLDDASGDPTGTADLLGQYGGLLAMSGDPEAGIRLYTRAETIRADLGASLLEAFRSADRGYLYLLAGRPAEAEAGLRRGYEHLGRIGDLNLLPAVGALLAQAIDRGGGPDDEIEQLARTFQDRAYARDSFAQIWSKSALAKVLARRGVHSEAESLAREAVRLAAACHSPNLHGDTLLDLAEVMRQAGDTADAATAVNDALRQYQGKGNLAGTSRARATLADFR
jgi:DNA-binding SARP family transcriptional activator/class 3 adenylate cyclase/tetratricopeptide (TPR) repeat protein